MKLEFVAIPAKRAAETDYGYLDEGDEVLKCFDLSRYATLFGFVAWAFENLARHADAHALFLPCNSLWPQVGKTSLAEDATLFWQVGEESGKSYGRGTKGFVLASC